jgi:hypothetical protein
VVDAETMQRVVAGPTDVLRRAVDPQAFAVRSALVAELRRELDVVSPVLDGLADQLLVGEGAVHVGRVEEGDAEVERAVDGLDAALLDLALVEADLVVDRAQV